LLKTTGDPGCRIIKDKRQRKSMKVAGAYVYGDEVSSSVLLRVLLLNVN
jgi:hypothetical protein